MENITNEQINKATYETTKQQTYTYNYLQSYI